MTIGQRLRAWRGGRTQVEAAKVIGIPQYSYCRYELDRMSPRAGAMQKLIAATAGTKWAIKLEHFADADSRQAAARTGTEG